MLNFGIEKAFDNIWHEEPSPHSISSESSQPISLLKNIPSMMNPTEELVELPGKKLLNILD